MNKLNSEEILNKIPDLKDTALSISRGIHDQVLERGDPTRTAADLLHGTWLGHPLHAVLTDVTLGAWMASGFLDLLAGLSRSRDVEQAADALTALGVASAVPTALAGLTDFTTIPIRAVSTGATHGLINITAFALNTLSVLNRRRGRRATGVFLSSISLGLLTISAWLGGELAYRYRVGVDNSAEKSGPKDWTEALMLSQLPERQLHRVDIQGVPILLFNDGGMVYAIGAVCAHDSGPLEEGKLVGDLCVECPLHQSVYSLRDGSIVHGPTTYPEPSYETRVVDGRVEVKLREG